MITKHFVMVGDRRVHYRRSGEGPPFVVMHPSPSSSRSMEPRIQRFAKGHTVIALDSPGYGESAPLAIEAPSVADYADALAETLTALGIEKTDLYGTHTGGTIAVEFAVRHPNRVHRLVLDGVSVYSEQERADLLENYTPSLKPEWDASHLLRGWMMMRDMRLFSPWYRRLPQNRLMKPLPSPEALHHSMVDFLRAGPEYYKGYKAVFSHDTAAALAQLTVPTLFTSANTDSLAKHVERVKDHASITIEPPADDETTAARILAYLGKGDPLPDAPPPPPVRSAPGVARRDYVMTSIGQLLMRRADSRASMKKRPLVLLHAMPGTSLHYERLLPVWSADRDVVTFDLPGNGDSAAFPNDPQIEDFALVIGEAIDNLNLGPEIDLYGAHTGAMISMQIGINRPQQIKHLILDGITLFGEEETADRIANYAPPMVPNTEGGHLVWAWNFRRDMGLWWPWNVHTMEALRAEGAVAGPDAMHAGFVEFMKGALSYHLSYRAAFSYPTRERLPHITQPMLQASSETDPLRACIPEAMTLSKNAQARVHKGMMNPEAQEATLATFRAFLADAPLPPGPTE